jgi:hypothetical protein
MNPPIIRDELLGELRWNDLVDWYESEVEVFGSQKIWVSVKVGSDGPDAAIEQARRDLPKVLANESSYRRAAAAALIDIHNTYWSEENCIDVQTFTGRMKLKRILFYVIYTELWYDDGDLFGGHTIYVEIDGKLAFKKAFFEG